MFGPFYRGEEREDFEEEEEEEGERVMERLEWEEEDGGVFAGRNLSETRTWQSSM